MKILVIEDDKKVAKALQRDLEKANYEVVTVLDGGAGFTQATGHSFDLIILDVTLANMDGLTLVKELRAGNFWTPVLILTARNAVDDIVSGLDAGSDGYLSKPFAVAEIQALVRSLLRRQEWGRGAELRFADLRLDPVAHKVWRADREIKLTGTE